MLVIYLLLMAILALFSPQSLNSMHNAVNHSFGWNLGGVAMFLIGCLICIVIDAIIRD